MSDSHTGFNSAAFTAGALTGVGLLAGAVSSGVANARQRSWDRFNRRALIAGLELTEERHNRLYKQLQAAHRRIGDLQSEVIGLRAELQAERARQILALRHK